ncbi:MAG TPA: hypothetical protein VGQ83_35145 [Polyangia bacterium]
MRIAWPLSCLCLLAPVAAAATAREQSHLLFAAFDVAPPAGVAPSPWGLNFGVGLGLTDATPQRCILKAIVTRMF